MIKEFKIDYADALKYVQMRYRAQFQVNVVSSNQGSKERSSSLRGSSMLLQKASK